MADAQDSKSCGGDFVWVQVPLSALNLIVRMPETQGFPAFSFTQIEVFIKLADFYNVSVDYLLERTKDK